MEIQKAKFNQKIAILDEIIKLCPSSEILRKKKEKLRFILEKNESKFVIALIGATSSGKSSFMNALIGEDIIPCQVANIKKALIISHTNNDDIKIIKGKVKDQECFSIQETQNAKIFRGKDKIIQAKEELSSLGKIKEKFEDSFYFVQIKMKIFELINEENAEKIQFIDFPGLDKGDCFEDVNKNDKPIFTIQSLGNFFNISDSFIFVNEADCIGEKGAQGIMKCLYDQILLRRQNNYMPFNKILFVLNKYDTVKKDNFDSTKQEILNTFLKKDNTELHVEKFSSTSLLQFFLRDYDYDNMLTDFDSQLKIQNHSIYDEDDENDKEANNNFSAEEILKKLKTFLENNSITSVREAQFNKTDFNKAQQSIKKYFQNKNIDIHNYEKEIKESVNLLLTSKDMPEICQECIKTFKKIINSLAPEREQNIIESLTEEYKQISNSLIRTNDIDNNKKEKLNIKVNDYFREYEKKTHEYFNTLEHELINKSEEIRKIQFNDKGKEQLEILNEQINSQMEVKFNEFFEKLNTSKNNLITNINTFLKNEFCQEINIKTKEIKKNKISKYSNSICENLKSKFHFISHGCWGAAHVVGAITAGALAATNPITIAILGGGLLVHLFIVLGVSLKDLFNKKETIKNHLTLYFQKVQNNLFTYKTTFYSDFVLEKEKVCEALLQFYDNFELNNKTSEEFDKLKNKFDTDEINITESFGLSMC